MRAKHIGKIIHDDGVLSYERIEYPYGETYFSVVCHPDGIMTYKKCVFPGGEIVFSGNNYGKLIPGRIEHTWGPSKSRLN